MGRPRVFVNRAGRPVRTNTGISLHRPTGRYYIVPRTGERKYYRTWDDARAALALAAAGDDPVTKPIRIPTDAWWSEVVRQFQLAPGRLIERLGIMEYLTAKGKIPARNVGEGPQLKQIGDAWREAMIAKHGAETLHVRTTMQRWNKFAKALGGPKRRVDTLTVADFRAWHRAVADKARKDSKSNKWYNDLCVAPKRVLIYVRRKYPNLGIPAAVCLWADSYDAKLYRASRSNATPASPTEFAGLIQACRAWAAIDPEQYDKTTQSGRGKRTQAARRRRAGIQMEAILRLGLNCALDPVDIERLAWSDLVLGGDVPHLNFARRKAEHKAGESIPRCIPLMPATLDALKAWQAVEGRTTGPVFRSARKGAMRKDFIARAIKSLKSTAAINGGLSFKHLRNVGPTIACRKLRSQALADMVLGHTINNEARKYVGDPTDPTVLRDLVREVGRVYKA